MSAGTGNAEALYYLACIYDNSREGKHPNKEIVEILEKSAGQGFVPAQLMLGRIYQFGRKGIPQDLKKARMWYELAAAKGANDAMMQLNAIYQQTGDAHTRAVLANENIEWLELGVKQGDAEAALSLAKIIETGKGVPQDYNRAADLYRIAAEAGLVQAQASLGKLYANGEGVEQDDEKAVFWLTKAAEEGHIEAQKKLASVYAGQSRNFPQAYAWQVIALSALFPKAQNLVDFSPDLEELMRSMTPEQIEKGQKTALDLVEKIKANKRKHEEEQKMRVEKRRRYEEDLQND